MSTSDEDLERQLAGGRELPRLLFVTHRRALDANIGADGATEVLDLIREANEGRKRADAHVVLEYLGKHRDLASALSEVHETIRENPVHGVVLLGGYDVVPSVRVDVLPPTIRTWVDEQPLDGDDADDWIVWCDDPYGDPEHTRIPEIPVSRIPDGRSKDLMLAALRAPKATAQTRRGIRNVNRPFAEDVFRQLPGEDEMLVSGPQQAKRLAKRALHASHVYIMLHGRNDIGRAFWGERHRHVAQTLTATQLHAIEAFNALQKPTQPRELTETMEQRAFNQAEEAMLAAVDREHMPGDGAVILSGCCWSAQAARYSARRWHRGRPLAPRLTQTSVALSALRGGARAFVGSTGSNYSPLDPADHFYCEPLHFEFWRQVVKGEAPARALLIAKHKYASGMPHGHRDDLTSLAIEHKTLHQYTCLGLGW
jgi:hypothetical protein